MKSVVSLVLLSIQLNQSLLQVTPGCGGIAYCKSYKPDKCNTCSCSDPINNPTLAMCTLAYCEGVFIAECTSCMDGYILSNTHCVQLSPVTPLIPPLPLPLPIKACICSYNYAPVCCSDGQTYSNQCQASCKGLTACQMGACITAIRPIPEPITPPCKYLPVCQDPCTAYFNYIISPLILPGAVQCQGYPNAKCQAKVDCNGCYAIFVDEYGNEIQCIPPPPPPPPPVTCYSDTNCQTWNQFFCRPDIKCSMNTNTNPSVGCNKVCYNINAMCSVNTDCTYDYNCIEGFCVKYQPNTPIYVIGRPYNIDKHAMDVKAGMKRMDCADYEFYFNDIEFANERNVSVTDQIISDWIDRALSEHASIATFSKFNLDLMSIGAPLWFLKTTSNATLDEIEHAKITFDIVNMYIKHSSGRNVYDECILFDDFPTHNIMIDADYNRISLDAANGGCFGETVSVFITYLNGYNSKNNLIQSYLHRVAMDEIRHASLSWVTVKWISDQIGDKMEVYHVNWWKTQLVKRNSNSMTDNIKQYVYKYVIPSILKFLWTDNGDLIQIQDYDKLYYSINSLLEHHLNVVIAKMMV